MMGMEEGGNAALRRLARTSRMKHMRLQRQTQTQRRRRKYVTYFRFSTEHPPALARQIQYLVRIKASLPGRNHTDRLSFSGKAPQPVQLSGR